MSPGVVDFLFRRLVAGEPAEDVQWGKEGTALAAVPPGAELARRLAETLSKISRVGRRTLVLGASAGKDVRSIAATLAPQVDRVFTTRCSHPRAVEPGAVAEALVGLSVPVMPAGSIEEALPLARAGEGLVVVAGSLFLVGAVRDLLGR